MTLEADRAGSTKTRGLRGSVFHAASEQERFEYDKLLSRGISADRAFDILADQVAERLSTGAGTWKRIV